MKQKVNLKKVATFLLSSAMMLSLSSMAFTLETNGSNIAPVHAEEQVEVDAKGTTSDDVYTLAGSSAESNVYSVEKSTNVIGYTIEGSVETPYSSFDEFFSFVRSTPNKQGTLYIRNDIVLTERIDIPGGLDITFVADNANGVEITGPSMSFDPFFLVTGSLTVLGNITLTGHENYVQAIEVIGTLNLGAKDNLEECPVIQSFSSSAALGNAIYACDGGTVNIYNARLINNHAPDSAIPGGAIYAEKSTVNFYNGEISGNSVALSGGGIHLDCSTLNMYGGTITNNISGDSGSGVYLYNSFLNMYGGTISGNLNNGSDADQVALDGGSSAMIVDGIVGSFDVSGSSHVFYTNGGTFENNIVPTSFPDVTREGYTLEYWSSSESLETEETSFASGIHYAKWKGAIGYAKEGDTETPYFSFEEFFAFIQNTPNKQGTLYIRNDIVLTERILIPDELDVTLVADNANGVEITGPSISFLPFFSVNGSLTMLGNITLTGHENWSYAFDVSGTLNLGAKDNLEEYPVIQNFSSDGGTGNAIIVSRGTVNIYNARLMNNHEADATTYGGAIHAEIGSTVNFYNGEISGNRTSNGGGIYLQRSTLNMYGGTITNNISGYSGSGVYLYNSFLNMYGGTISGNLNNGSDADQVMLYNSSAMIVGGTVGSFSVGDSSHVFYTNGGTFENNTVLTEFPIPTLEGYALEYWSNSASLETAETSFASGIHYAKWKKIEPYFDDIASYRESVGYTSPSEVGYVFGGWYSDADYTTPIGKDVTSGPAYAKYVDAKVMDVKAQITAETTKDSTSTDMRIVSTVDSLMYRDAGFIISIKKETKISCRNVYTKLVAKDGGVVFNYTPTYFSNSSKYFTTYTIKNIPNASFGTEIKVTPYWVTMDGTMVMGKQVIKTVNGCLG